jgi:hypothetical protein
MVQGNGTSNGKSGIVSAAGAGLSSPSADSVVYNDDLLEGENAPAEVLELAAACVRFVAASIKLQPDFTPETMALVDHYVREARQSVAASPNTLALTAHAVGAYLGESVRRHYRCWWRIDGNDPGAWRLEMATTPLAFYPIQVAHTCLIQAADNAAFSGFEMPPKDYQLALERIERLPPVSPEDYHLPSTRLEVLEVLVDYLTAHHAQGPFGSRTLRPEDYQ